jgi:hypothetical protein
MEVISHQTPGVCIGDRFNIFLVQMQKVEVIILKLKQISTINTPVIDMIEPAGNQFLYVHFLFFII